MTTKQERVEHANQLIRIIGSHGRRFFYHAPANRFARLELRAGRVYFIDDYSDRAIYTHRSGFPGRWRGFSHGGTLRGLVELMRDYIVQGTQIPHWHIAPHYIRTDGNVWGYDEQAAKAVRDAAYQLPIVGPHPVEIE